MKPAFLRRLGFGWTHLALAPVRRRRSQSGLALASLALAAGLITALLTLQRGTENHLSSGFRRYGANLVVTPGAGRGRIPLAAAAPVLAAFPESVGLLYLVGQANGQPLVVAGADPVRLRAMNTEWTLSPPGAAAPPQPGETWIGVEAARLLHVHPGDTVEVAFGKQRGRWRIVGTVASGGSEDNQLLAPYAAVASLTGLDGYTTLQLRIKAAAISAAQTRLRALLPGAVPQPVRAIAAGEATVLRRTRVLLLACSALILITVGLCVGAALSTLALERRRDFALMKALGGTEAEITLGFVGEAAMVGAMAAGPGAAVGTGVAGLIGETLFRLWLWPDPVVLAAAGLGTVALAMLAALLPWPIVHSAEPAVLLRGD